MSADRKVRVIVLNWNGREDTTECIEALLNSTYEAFDVDLIDNGSSGDDADVLATLFADEPRVTVRSNKSNLGFTGGMNEAMERALTDPAVQYFALLNNDAVVAETWLTELVSTAQANDAAIVASRMINYFDHESIDNAGHIWLNTGEILPRGTGQHPSQFGSACQLVGACAGAALYSADLIRKIGTFDRYFDTGYEDAEFGLRAFLAGYPTHYCPSALVFHKISQSIDKVRDVAYAIGIQKNINYTMLKLTPTPVLLINIPFILLKTIAVPLTALLTLRMTLLRAHLSAIAATVGDLGCIWSARRTAKTLTKGSTWKALGAQKFFLGVYAGYFRDYILTGKKTVFER